MLVMNAAVCTGFCAFIFNYRPGVWGGGGGARSGVLGMTWGDRELRKGTVDAYDRGGSGTGGSLSLRAPLR